MTDHMQDVLGFLGFFVIAYVITAISHRIGASAKRKRNSFSIKAGDVITKKIPKQEPPEIPIWANCLMEHRVTGEIIPASAGSCGFWFLGGEETEPERLDLREWGLYVD